MKSKHIIKEVIFNIDFTIDQDDLKALYINASFEDFGNITFKNWIKITEESYVNYFNRNLSDLQKYGTPKTFSRWVNGQIIALTENK